MDEDFAISILGSIGEAKLQQLSAMSCESRCTFTREADCEDEDYFIPCQQVYVMQVRGDYLVEVGSKSNKLIGGVRLSLDFRFEIKRFFSTFASDLAQPFAFILYYPEQEDNQIVIKLGVENEGSDQLEKFACCLERKPIQQLDMHQNFKINQRLSVTATACVYSATHYRSGKSVAIKCMKKELFSETGRTLEKVLEREYLIPFRLNHPHICKLAGIYDSDSTVYIIMELFSMNFLQFNQKRGFRSADEFRTIFRQICSAVHYLHSHSIMHRDLKLENIMMRQVGQDQFEPVIIDFGLSEEHGKLPYIFTRCGTPGYTAPEIVNCERENPDYDCKCDVFSLGAVFYDLLLKRPLFGGKKLEEVIEKNKKCQINQDAPEFKMIHENARDLLLLMLKINPQERISSQAVLEHPFFAEGLREAKADGDKIEGPKTESHESAMVGRENAIVGRDRYPAQKDTE